MKPDRPDLQGWYWRRWRAADNLKQFARLWDRDGLKMSIVLLVFLILGGVGMFIAAFNLPQDDRQLLLAAGLLFTAMGLGLAGIFYAGVAAASVAHSTDRRLTGVERQLVRRRANTKRRIAYPRPSGEHFRRRMYRPAVRGDRRTT